MECVAVLSILFVSPNEIDKFKNTGARRQDSIHHMTLKSHLTSKRQDFNVRNRGVFVDVIAYTLPGLFACLNHWWITVFMALLCYTLRCDMRRHMIKLSLRHSFTACVVYGIYIPGSS